MKIFERRSRSFFVVVGLAAVAIASVAGAADVALYGVVKGENYVQNNPTTPFLSDDANGGGGKFFFTVFVNLDYAFSVTNATVQIPGGPLKQLQLNNTADRWEVLDSFDAPFFQGAAYPNGAYVLALQPVSDGNKTLTLALSGNYASIPFILNFNALQAVVASNDFNVTWAIPGGTINDFVQLQILQVDSTGFISEIFNSGQPGDVGALNGTTTSASLPADTLSPGTIYSGRLLVGTR